MGWFEQKRKGGKEIKRTKLYDVFSSEPGSIEKSRKSQPQLIPLHSEDDHDHEDEADLFAATPRFDQCRLIALGWSVFQNVTAKKKRPTGSLIEGHLDEFQNRCGYNRYDRDDRQKFNPTG